MPRIQLLNFRLHHHRRRRFIVLLRAFSPLVFFSQFSWPPSAFYATGESVPEEKTLPPPGEVDDDPPPHAEAEEWPPLALLRLS